LAESQSVQKGKFPVIGFVKDPTGVAALYLGKREGKDLVYMGKVGTGWSRTVSSQIRKQLDTVVGPKSKLTKQVRKPKATWVEPTFFCRCGVSGHYVRRVTPPKLVQGLETVLASGLAAHLAKSVFMGSTLSHLRQRYSVCPVLSVIARRRLLHFGHLSM
jgi:hypothetical protein